MFVAPASGIAAAFAFIRGFIRKNFGLGNFYVDFIRIILTLLLPVAFGSALLLMVLGVPQTLNSSVTISHTLEGHNQTLQQGPLLLWNLLRSLEAMVADTMVRIPVIRSRILTVLQICMKYFSC